jgi:hypothetical protein
MKYRVRFDMSFINEADAGSLMEYGKSVVNSAAGGGQENEETSFCEMELCRHDEGLPCTLIERVVKG